MRYTSSHVKEWCHSQYLRDISYGCSHRALQNMLWYEARRNDLDMLWGKFVCVLKNGRQRRHYESETGQNSCNMYKYIKGMGNFI